MYFICMSKFYTEKETEEFLENETRVLTLPDGNREVVTTLKMTWDAFDCMHHTKSCSNEQIIQWTYEWYKRDQKYDFTTYFWNMVAFIFQKVKGK